MIRKIENVQGSSYVVRGLKESSTYAFYVQDAAHADDPAALSNRMISSTVCTAVSGNGYSYSFEVGPNYKAGKSPKESGADGFTFQWPESTTAGDTVYRTPDCWTVGIDMDGYDPTSTTYKNYNPTMIPNSKAVRYSLTGGSALQFYGTAKYCEVYAVMPSLIFDKDTAELVFYGRCFNEKIAKDGSGTVASTSYIKGGSTTAYSQQLAVGFVTDPADISTFVPVDTVEYSYSIEDLSTSTNVDNDPAGIRYFQKFTVPLRGAKGQFIAFRQVGYGYMWIDDVSIQKHQTPRAPRSLSQDQVTTSSAVLTWRPMEKGGTYTLQYMKRSAAINWNSATTVNGITEATYTLSSLTDATEYVWRVRQDDSEFGTSEYAPYASFRTDCNSYSPNGYATSFEGTTADPATVFYKSGSTEYLQNKCWTYINQGTSTTMGTSWAYNIPATSNASYAHSGKSALKLYDYSTTYRTVAVTPRLDAEVGVSGVGFDTLQVSFWMCPSPHGLSGSKKDKISTASTKTASKMIEVGTCTDPDDPTTYTVLQTCIYECEGNALSTGVQADAKNDYAFRKVIVPLDKATGPYVFFRANKDRVLDDGSVCTSSTMYVDDVQFETIQRCNRATDVTISDITIHNAKLTWQSAGQLSFDVEVSSDASFNDSTALVFAKSNLTVSEVVIDGLKAATQFYCRVKSYCNEERTEESDWTQAVSFRTPFAPVFNETFTSNDLTSSDKGWKMMKGYAKDIFAGGELETNTSSSDYNSWYRIENNVIDGMHLRMALFYAAANGVPTATYQAETYYQKYWLITPLITIEKTGAQLIFDAALSTYEYLAKTKNQPITVNPAWNTGWDDQFMIIVSEDGGETWKRENATIWNNEKSNDPADKHYRYGIGDYRLTDIAYDPHKISIDLSKYAGKTIKIAFYGENTNQNANCAIHIDNVRVNYVVREEQTLQLCQFEDVDDVLGFNIDGDTASIGTKRYERFVMANKEGVVDSIFTLNTEVREAPIYNYEITVCEGTPFQYMDFNEHTTPGTYRMKLTSQVTGCDSIVNFTIRHTPKFDIRIDTTICEGGAFQFGDTILTTAGIYTQSFKTSEALGGCDSIVTVNLKVINSIRKSINQSICQGESFLFDGKERTQAGIYTSTSVLANGCDSITTLTLLVNNPIVKNEEVTICEGSSYTLVDTTLTTEGTYTRTTFSRVTGCDSTTILTLRITPASITRIDTTICEGDAYRFRNLQLTQDSLYTFKDIEDGGCISWTYVRLHVNKISYTAVDTTFCEGSGYVLGDTILKTPVGLTAQYTGVLRSKLTGCDSVVTVTYKITPAPVETETATICGDESYPFTKNGKTILLSEAGTYRDTIYEEGTNYMSIKELRLRAYKTVRRNLPNDTICEGAMYQFKDTTLSTTGMYTHRVKYLNAPCDSIVTTLYLYVTPAPVDQQEASICDGESYPFIKDGKTVLLSETGTYRDTLYEESTHCMSIKELNLKAYRTNRTNLRDTICEGTTRLFEDTILSTTGVYTRFLKYQNTSCDSLIKTLFLTVTPVPVITETASFCEGTTYDFAGKQLSKAGIYRDTTSSEEGCMSITELTLSMNPIQHTSLDIRYINSGDTCRFFGDTLTASGTYSHTLQSVITGCDSIVTLHLVVLTETTGHESRTICANELPIVWKGQTISQAGTYQFDTFTVVGTDSTVTLSLQVINPVSSNIRETICQGGKYLFGDTTLTTAGMYERTLTSLLTGCDSIITLNLSVNPALVIKQTASFCEGTTYDFAGKQLDKVGIYRDTTYAEDGCMSITELRLSVIRPVATTLDVTICEGSTYTFGEQKLSKTGSFKRTIPSLLTGCDSIITLDLTVTPAPVDRQSYAICAGDSYLWNGKSLDQAGIYRDTTYVDGCMSIAELVLRVNQTVEGELITQYTCGNEPYTFNGRVLTKSGIYYDTLPSRITGCDSIAQLQLVMLQTTTLTIPERICRGQVFDFYGRELTESGIYYDTIRYSVIDCDSLITTLQLTVVEPTQSELNVNICAGGEYILGDTILTTAGDYTRKVYMPNNVVCDSATITVHLTVNEPLRGTKFASFSRGCSYTFNGKTYDQPGEYEIETLKTEAGCDSIITLVLTEVEQGRDTVWATVCPGEYYIDADFNTNVPGSHEITVEQDGGCSIIRTLILSNTDNNVVQHASICPGDSYEFYGETLTVSGTYTATLRGQGEQCDTTVTLTLNVLTNDTAFVNDSITTAQLPYLYAGEVILPLDTKEGIYHDTIEVKSESGTCSQIVVLTITVRQADAVDNVGYHTLQIRPNAVRRDETVYIDNSFTASERAEMTVEMFDMLGHRMDVRIPQSGAITISDFPAAGIYTVRISTGEQTYIGRIVVKN